MGSDLDIAGIGLMGLGVILWTLGYWPMVRWSVEARKLLIQEAENGGDFGRAERIRRETEVIEKRVPFYGKVIVAIGAVLFLCPFFV